MISESSFGAALLPAINAPDRRTRVQRINSGTLIFEDERHGRRAVRGAAKGTADYIGFAAPDGLYIELEIKAATGRPTPMQLTRANWVRLAGGVYLFVYCDKYDLDKAVRDALERLDEAIAEVRRARAA